MNQTRVTGILGMSSVCIFALALITFGWIHPDFHFFQDYISKLGARGEPLALAWNLTGFVTVGILLSLFGLSYGKILKDSLIGVLLFLFGLGFALTAIPFDMDQSELIVSRIHKAVICLGLASWLFALARLGYNQSLEVTIRTRANLTALSLVAAILGHLLGIWSMPVTHRLVFAIVFLWTVISSMALLKNKE